MLYEKQFEKSLNCYGFFESSLVIASTGRSGSHFLGHILSDTGLIGSPFEYYHPQNIKEWHRRLGTNNVDELTCKLKEIRTSELTGIFSTKLHYSQFKFLGESPEFFESLGNTRFIYIKRKDVLGQAISMVIARQTGQWISDQTANNISPVYSFDEINYELKNILIDNASWEHYFNTNGIVPCEIIFEDLLRDTELEIRKIAKYLNININFSKAKDDAFKGKTAKQSNDINSLWKDRFLSDNKIKNSNFSLNYYDVKKNVRKYLGKLKVKLLGNRNEKNS